MPTGSVPGTIPAINRRCVPPGMVRESHQRDESGAALRLSLRRGQDALGRILPGKNQRGKAAPDRSDGPGPRLWWPRGYGEAALYSLKLALTSGGDVRDQCRIRFGCRRVTSILRDEAGGEHRFGFEVNGTRIFLMGACMVALEGMTHVSGRKSAPASCWTWRSRPT